MVMALAVMAVLAADPGLDEPVADEVRRLHHRPAFEVNVLWPFFPGGQSDLKVLVPVLRAEEKTFGGQALVGLHSDFNWGLIRPADQYGKVFLLAVKLGWRQFFAFGFHLDVLVHVGWRHEERNVYDGGTLDGLTGRLWALAGWQYEFNSRVYANVRGGGGLHLFRTDRFGDKEKVFAPAGDVNLGFKF